MSSVDPAEALRARFGHASFRPGQEAVVRAVLAGNDVLAVMPTGSGKSIGYQLPAVLLPGLTLVVSPLIALMKDQVDELGRKGIPAAALHSLLAPQERRETVAAARDGKLLLLYVAPERFGSEAFDRLLGELLVARFAVDEAHCVSEWGHDFRPDYRRLAGAAARCRRADGGPGRPPVLAFTATATPEVREDIVALLGLEQPEVFVAGFDRPNLFLSVLRVGGGIEKRRLLPGLVGERRALVYAATRKSAERAAEALRTAGIDADAYHAGLPEEERTRVQEAFAAGTLRVVCATNAFGMGIDRPDVEAVVHYELPGSLEAYYQEIGRGGRDGRRADATLLWNYSDVKTREFLLEKGGSEEDAWRERVPADPVEVERKRELDRRKLRRMIAYADSATCLRGTLLRYFGERGAPERCRACLPCASRRGLTEDELLLVRKALSGVARGGERWGRRKIASLLAGELEGLPDSLTRLSSAGLLRSLKPFEIAAWLDAAVAAGLLRASDDAYRTLSLTPLGRDVMAGRTADFELAPPQPLSPKVPASRKPERARPRRTERKEPEAREPLPPSAVPVLAVLKEWRRSEAARRSVPAYVVFHDRTLEAIATHRPTSLETLAVVPGVGPAKLDAYGPAILALLAPPHPA